MALETWGEYYKLVQDKAYSIPNTLNERRLIVFKKIKPFPVSDEFFESLGLQDEDGKDPNITG
jgi:16S rRNA (guanine527-N7)-methyltransferase